MTTSFPHLRPSTQGVLFNVTTSSGATTLPLLDDGTFPRYCRLMTQPLAAGTTTFCFVNIGVAAVTASTTGLLVTSNEQVILATRGYSYLSAIHPSTTCNLSITPLSDG